MTRMHETMANEIATRTVDPALWLKDLRGVAERLRLDVTRCIPLASTSLQTACFAVCGEATKQGRTDEQIRAAI